jgi:glyoxalase family protein
MAKLITGIHHITALTANAQENFNFYAGVLGLRLVKKTVNFDAPEIYHFYYGNEKGSPGTILTFFPYPDLPRGRKGKGQLTVTSFSIGRQSIDFWLARFKTFKVFHHEPAERFNNEVYIYFEDSEGLSFELVANDVDERTGYAHSHIPVDHAIRGFYGITIAVEGYEKTAGLLTAHLDHVLIDEKGNRFRYSASGKPGDFVDLVCSPDLLLGLGGAGTVHHVAFATENHEQQEKARERLLENHVNVTPILDREYFQSIYFREPGGVLFEIATLSPGFMVDEDVSELGMHLKLPSWMESSRDAIERQLEPLNTDLSKF